MTAQKTTKSAKRRINRGGRRAEHSPEEIKELVLLATEKIAQEEGLSGLSARKIANEIGYNVAMLYHLYDNLDHIILKVNVRTLDRLYLDLQEGVSKCRSPRTCLVALGHRYIDFALENRNLWNMIFEHSLPEEAPLPVWYRSKVERMFALVESHIEPLGDDISAKQIEQAAYAIWCGVHGICVLWVTRKLELSVKDLHALSESLVNNYLIGLTAKS